jgi:hypothetical protein
MTNKNNDIQRVTVTVTLVAGPDTEAIAEKLLRTVTEELFTIGAELTTVRVEIKGHPAAW